MQYYEFGLLKVVVLLVYGQMLPRLLVDLKLPGLRWLEAYGASNYELIFFNGEKCCLKGRCSCWVRK